MKQRTRAESASLGPGGRACVSSAHFGYRTGWKEPNRDFVKVRGAPARTELEGLDPATTGRCTPPVPGKRQELLTPLRQEN